ncbi:MAG: glutamate--tRNA ligase [Methanobacteriaceae archaeon]
MDEMEKTIYKYALLNAIKFKGNANPGAVIGSIMSSEPDLRSESKTIGKVAGPIVAKVNGMELEEQENELNNIGVDIQSDENKKAKATDKKITELSGSHENVVMRFAPNPSGPLHIGHARAACGNNEYVKKYNGKLILRIEDTDPKRIYTPAYDMISEDLEWLGVKINEVFFQSDRFPIYYDYATKLIENGGAYMCTCDGGDFKKLKDDCKPCPCRDNTVTKNMEIWDKFDTMDAGDAVLRIKTDIQHKNPAIRDWVAMRIVEEEHPRLKNQYSIYPMMNFAVAIDDHLMNMSHVLRGKDHLANSEKQKYLYNHMDWNAPDFIHYGRLKMEDIALSTSKAMEGIESGEYSGWDDPRLGTLRAIARRGIQKEAISTLMDEIGIKMTDSAVSWKKIYGLNRNILEEKVNRYFFVANPKRFNIDDLDDNSEIETEIIERPLHPDFLDRGNRKLAFNGDVYVSNDDVNTGIARLMDAVNVDIVENDNTMDESKFKMVYNSKTFQEARELKAKIIQWVSVSECIEAKIVMPNSEIVTGYCESACNNLKVGDIVQFERFGFARLDSIENNVMKFYFAHK